MLTLLLAFACRPQDPGDTACRRSAETCDGVDNDCDGQADDADPDVLNQPRWFEDADGDGFGNALASDLACVQPPGTLPDGADCNDADSAVHPDADEVCNDIDDDCDGLIDDDDDSVGGTPVWYEDDDGDGYGAGAATAACAQPDGAVRADSDCDDADPFVNPGAVEVCDDIDDDCDGFTDGEDDSVMDATTWYGDADGDGFGDGTRSETACEAPSSTVADATDCDDSDASVNPGAVEICDDIDDDCDGLTDGRDPSLTGASVWYDDSDGDTYGDTASARTACNQPHGSILDGTDCDDARSDVHPGAVEFCDSRDNDCDGLVDDDDPDTTGGVPRFTDWDGDGYGDPQSYRLSCGSVTGLVENGHDCDDADASSWACAGSLDDGSICADEWGTDLGLVPAWTGDCNTDLGFVPFEDHCYWPGPAAEAMPDARASCAAAGGYLATEQSTGEDHFLLGYLDQRWLGACDGDEEGTWRWFTGEAWETQLWSEGEPDGGSALACVGSFNVPGRYRWFDSDCTSVANYVCEFGGVVLGSDRESAAPDCALSEVTPAAEALDVDGAGSVTVTFAAPMDSSTFDADSFVVVGEVSGILGGVVDWSGSTATWTPDGAARPGERVTASLTDDVRCADGGRVTPRVWSWFAEAQAGTASWAAVTTGWSGDPRGLAVADFDGDGILEAVVADAAELVLLDDIETGAATVLDAEATVGRPVDLVSFDVDSDGDMDVVGVEQAPDRVVAWLNDGTGSLTEGDYEEFDDSPTSVAASDFDADGDLDLLVVLENDSVETWLRNDGTGNFSVREEQRADETWWQTPDLSVADLDGEGDQDLIRPDYDPPWLGVRLNDGAAGFSDGPTEAISCSNSSCWPLRVWAGDFDGDGTPDLAVSSISLFYLYGNDGTGDFDLRDDESVRCSGVAGGDLDADGDLDAVCVGYPQLTTLLNSSGNLRASGATATFSGSDDVDTVIADVDGDGALDVVVSSGGALTVYLNTP